MRILIAPDSFKGSMTSKEVGNIISKSLSEITNANIKTIELADGGEGFGESLISYFNGKKKNGIFHDIYMNEICAPIYYYNGTAVVESAITCHLQPNNNVMNATSYGVGEQIKFAYESGFKQIILGLGGSGMCDGGAGALEALGVSFFNKNGSKIENISSKDIENVFSLSKSDKFIKISSELKITYACDVTNKYFGKTGAAYIFAPQKGATATDVIHLDNGLINLNNIFDNKIDSLPSMGAAGGLCGGLYSFFAGDIKSGFDVISQQINLEQMIKDCDLVVTGEGKTDCQTLMGKLPYKISLLAKKYHKKCVVISGDSDGTIIGDKIITLTSKDISKKQAIDNCKKILFDKAKYILQ